MSAIRRRIVATIDNPEGDAPSLDVVRSVMAERAEKTERSPASYA